MLMAQQAAKAVPGWTRHQIELVSVQKQHRWVGHSQALGIIWHMGALRFSSMWHLGTLGLQFLGSHPRSGEPAESIVQPGPGLQVKFMEQGCAGMVEASLPGKHLLLQS